MTQKHHEAAKDNVLTPNRGRPSGHTPDDATDIHSKERTPEPPGAKNHAPIEKARPSDTDRNGA